MAGLQDRENTESLKITYQVVYYAFEQCSKSFLIMPQLCSIAADYAPQKEP